MSYYIAYLGVYVKFNCEEIGMKRETGKRGLNRRPGKGVIDQCWLTLRKAADSGDVAAAAKLIELDHMLGASQGRQGVQA